MVKRRIFVAGLNDDNVKGPPQDSELFMFDFKSDDGSIKEVHLWHPNNLIIADVDWLRKNWSIVEDWAKNEQGSHMHDISLYKENMEK